MRVAGDCGIELAHAFGRINDEQRDIRRLQMLARHDDGELFSHQLRLALATDARGINEAKALAVPLDHFVHRVAGGARCWRDDGALRTRKAIQQCGFTDVGVADDSNFDFGNRS